MTGSPVQRITMDKSYGFGVSWADVLAWSGGALYLGNCDYSDSDEETGGFDIDEPLALLAWLITDRFGQSNDALSMMVSSMVRMVQAGKSSGSRWQAS